jgi:glycosyltransferase involved in cell wall biosynthesis
MDNMPEKYFPRIGIIVPAFNEEHALPAVLDVLCETDLFSQAIIVDDGSTDDTCGVADHYSVQDSRISSLCLEINSGKACGMLAGLQTLQPEVNLVMFLDADLIGLTPGHLQQLAAPIVNRTSDMTVALFRKGYWCTDLSHTITPFLSGQRCLSRMNAELTLHRLAFSGYGVETGMTLIARQRGWRLDYMHWIGVSHVMKESKVGMLTGTRRRTKMYGEVLATAVHFGWQDLRRSSIFRENPLKDFKPRSREIKT